MLDLRRQYGLVSVGEQLYYNTHTDPNADPVLKKALGSKQDAVKAGWQVPHSAEMASTLHACHTRGTSEVKTAASQLALMHLVSTKVEKLQDLTEAEAQYMLDNGCCEMLGPLWGGMVKRTCEARLARKWKSRSTHKAEREKKQAEHDQDQRGRRAIWDRIQAEEEASRARRAAEIAPPRRMSKKERRRQQQAKAAELAAFMDDK
jgi:hypothetical protein